jgi:GTP cyclohydrolase III
VKAFIDFKGFKVLGVMTLSFSYFSQKALKFYLGGDHIMYCILYYGSALEG